MNKWELARRDLLKGLGLGMGCLPLLHASNVWGAPTGPRRLLIVMNTNGLRQQYWKPKEGDLMTQTPPRLVLAARALQEGHHLLPDMSQPAYAAAGTARTSAAWPRAPTTTRASTASPTPRPSTRSSAPGWPCRGTLNRATLPLGIQIAGGNAGIFPSKRMCWKDRNTPITPEENIYTSYADVFAGKSNTPGDGAAIKSLMAHKKSLLDYAGGSLDRFKARLGNDDKEIIESHLHSVRDLENQLASPKVDLTKCGSDPGQPLDVKGSGNYPTLFKLSLDLMVAAIRCDVTRVVTLAPCDASGSNISFKACRPRGQPRLALDGPQPRLGRRRQQALRRQVADGPVRRADRAPEGRPRGHRHHARQHHRPVGQPHGGGGQPQQPEDPLDAGRQREQYFKLGQCAPSAGRPVNGVLYHIAHALGFPVEYIGTQDFGGGWDGLAA
jgi:hypothetical protein